MVYTGAALFRVTTSVGLGRMPRFATLSVHVRHTMGDQFDTHVNN